jgi:hypothetical protein
MLKVLACPFADEMSAVLGQTSVRFWRGSKPGGRDAARGSGGAVLEGSAALSRRAVALRRGGRAVGDQRAVFWRRRERYNSEGAEGVSPSNEPHTPCLDHLAQPAKGRGSAFLLDQKGREDRAVALSSLKIRSNSGWSASQEWDDEGVLGGLDGSSLLRHPRLSKSAKFPCPRTR